MKIGKIGLKAKENSASSKEENKADSLRIDQERKFILGQGSGNFFSREAFNTLRTNISFSLADTEDSKVIMVTSAMQSEGKSITAVNLALTIAETNGGVLLIDCDMRKPKIGRLLQLKSEIGLSNVLLKPSLLRESVFHYNDSVDVILSGSIPPNPSELLASARMQSLLEALRKSYDYIILDTPPVNIVTDAVALSPRADGVLFAVRAGQSERGMVTQAVEHLQYANAKIMGFVLTCVPLEKTNYGSSKHRYKNYARYGYKRYGYGNGYGNGYGYGSGYGYGYGNGYGYGYGGYGGYGYGYGERSHQDRGEWRAAAHDKDEQPL